MELKTIVSDGKEFTFNVLLNTAKPCPQCGVLACGREDVIWFVQDDKRKAIIFDGGFFDLAIEDFLTNNLKNITYHTLPEFIKQLNESRGWTDASDYEGYVLDVDDFLKSVTLLKSCKMGKWITVVEIETMEKLAVEAKEKGGKLKIVRG